MSTIHYGSRGQAECGADEPNMGLTMVVANVTCQTCRGWLPIVAPIEADVQRIFGDRPEPTLPRRLGWMADAMVSAKVGPQARFFTRDRVDEIVMLLREAEKFILEGKQMTDTSFEELHEIACKELAYSRAQRDQLLTAAKLALEEFRYFRRPEMSGNVIKELETAIAKAEDR